jgi:hypothetical protein
MQPEECEAAAQCVPRDSQELATPAMTDPHHFSDADLMEYNGYQIRLSPRGEEWMAVVAQPKQRPTLIMASDRDAAIAKAYEWIALQLATDPKPE